MTVVDLLPSADHVKEKVTKLNQKIEYLRSRSVVHDGLIMGLAADFNMKMTLSSPKTGTWECVVQVHKDEILGMLADEMRRQIVDLRKDISVLAEEIRNETGEKDDGD